MQELAIQPELIGFLAITSPSLQDFLYQKIRHKHLELLRRFGFSNPSLQALKCGVFYPVPSAKYDFVSHIPGVAPCISPSNQDFAPASTVCCPFGQRVIFWIILHLFDAAKVFSSHAGNLAGCRIDGFFTRGFGTKRRPATSICTSDLLVHGFHPPWKTITSSRLTFKDVPARIGSCGNGGWGVLLDRKKRKKMESKRTFSKSLFFKNKKSRKFTQHNQGQNITASMWVPFVKHLFLHFAKPRILFLARSSGRCFLCENGPRGSSSEHRKHLPRGTPPDPYLSILKSYCRAD